MARAMEQWVATWNGVTLCSGGLVAGIARHSDEVIKVLASETESNGIMDARIIADIDCQYPGIATAVVHREMSTAESFHRP